MTDDDATPQSGLAERQSAIYPGEFSTSSQRDGDIHTLRLFGELDLATADQVNEELGHIEDGDAGSVVLDLSGLTFMDSTGIQLILRTHLRLRGSPHTLTIRRGPPAVQRVFTMCSVDDQLPFAD